MLETSSYAGLNGFSYKEELSQFVKDHDGLTVSKAELGHFLTTTVGKMGDRHAYVRGYELPNTKFFPLAFAPYNEEILVLDFHPASRQYRIKFPSFPILTSIDHVPVDKLLPEILPEEVSAPQEAYFTRAVRKLRDIEEIYGQLGKSLPNPIEITLSNDQKSKDTTIQLLLVDRDHRMNKWDEKFYRQFFYLDEEEFNQKEVFQQLFTVDEGIGYVRIPDMVGKDEAPQLYAYLNQFMHELKQESAGLIIDVRSNGGGVRDLIYEMAGYFVHPDSIYVVNAVQQRGKIPLNQELKEDLHHRFLFSIDELEQREKEAVHRFHSSFQPMYELDETKFSQFHYAVFNGQKLSKDKFFYEKPIFILTNERSFSAASVLVALFKGVPNIYIAGVNTDGSSGNSERFTLPNTQLKGKISTMVSFQKDGKVLDGYGTAPDINISRDLEQILWKSDTQLEKLREIIHKGEYLNSP
ncbi:MAG: S41 family peptidase [Bacteroidota bacterium]